jgi:phytoene/squalene synthetase
MRRSPQEQYDQVAIRTAGVVLQSYSTSFGLACRLLAPRVRVHVENIYALVRIADEVVDGVAAASNLGAAGVAECLDGLERETESALACGYSSNLVVHAFALTARRTGFGAELTKPFFASMRADLQQSEHTDESLAEYIYGSAEVVGLMCLAAFLSGTPNAGARFQALAPGARRLGAAFQKVNFLRDLGADLETLGRSYFPSISPAGCTEQVKDRILDDIESDLNAALPAVLQLPPTSRRAVLVAHAIFAELAVRLRQAPAADLMHTRVRVPNRVKARIAAAALIGGSDVAVPGQRFLRRPLEQGGRA